MKGTHVTVKHCQIQEDRQGGVFIIHSEASPNSVRTVTS